jgi:uncharacterized repeat protein (TIGR01451 family)
MGLKADPPPGASTPVTFENTELLERDVWYQSSLPTQEGADHWYWDVWSSGSALSTRIFAPTLSNIASGSHTCVLRSFFQGASFDNVVFPDHHLELYVNNWFVGHAYWDGREAYEGEHTFPQSYLKEGDNTIKVEAPGDTGAVYDAGYINWLEITYHDTYTAEDDQLRFNGDVTDSAPISYTYAVGGFSSEDVEAFDITDPAHPQIISATVESGSTYTLTFRDTISETTAYLALTTARRLSPDSIELDEPSDLRGQGWGADYVVITHGDFYTDVVHLADYREAQGLRTAVVDVQEVYDEFSYGVFDPQAIHDFLAYTYQSWAPPAPSYVVLVGDGHYDFKDNLGLGQRNYVPPYLAMVDPSMGETAADNRYVMVSGDDILPDMHIGRLAVQSSGQASATVEKILAYEQSPMLGGAPGDWNSKVLFVADDPEPFAGGAGHFWELSDGIANDSLPNPYAAERVYYDEDPATSYPGYPGGRSDAPPYYRPASDARAAIVAAIHEGRLLVNYIGHGATHYWAHEQLFRVNEIANLNNDGRLPMMLPMTCLEGAFHDVRVSCLGERIVRAVGEGAVASWSPTGLGRADGHDYLNRGFFSAVFEHDVREIGPATTEGKLFLYANSSGSYHDLVDTYVLFGDPALGLNTLGADVGIGKRVEPERPVRAGETLTYTLTYFNTGPATAHHVVISDILPTELISATMVSGITPRAGSRFVWDVGDLAAGEHGAITIRAVVGPAAWGIISNTATIASSAREENAENNVASPVFTAVERPVGGATVPGFGVARGEGVFGYGGLFGPAIRDALSLVVVAVLVGLVAVLLVRPSVNKTARR